MKIQRNQYDSTWIDETDDEQINMIIDRALEREPWYAPRVGREPMTTRQQVLDYLACGGQLSYGSNWYEEIRDSDALEARPTTTAEMVECNCGHEVERVLVMRASLGTTCPNCYDRMSG